MDRDENIQHTKEEEDLKQPAAWTQRAQSHYDSL